MYYSKTITLNGATNEKIPMTTPPQPPEQLRDFFALTPDRILAAVESFGVECTGRWFALNSMENRVFEVELDVDPSLPKYKRFLIAKFYRPGRWSREQIFEEHQFLYDLAEREIPVAAPVQDGDGASVRVLEGTEIPFSVFPRLAGRSPDELQEDDLPWLGRLLARMHTIGGLREAHHRVNLTVESYGLKNIAFLLENNHIDREVRSSYERVARTACDLCEPLLAGLPTQRIHGDCHLANVIQTPEGPALVDFDDMVVGPVVQDVWLLVPGRDAEASYHRELLLEAYETFRPFPREQLRAIEALRTLRFIHYAAWLARRWTDPAFQRVFSFFGAPGYWARHVGELEEQVRVLG